MAQTAEQKKAAAEKRAADKAAKDAAAQAATGQATPEAPAPEPVAAAPEASPVATIADLNKNTRLPESGPSDTSESVRLEGPDGGRVTVPERMVDTMRSQGFKPVN